MIVVSSRHFVIILDSLPIDRSSVKSGRNSEETVIVARCINVGLFLSNGLRRDVVIDTVVLEKNGLVEISFQGHKLRRVSPDERSIAHFLLKAVDSLDSISQGQSAEMPNGIHLFRGGFEDLLSQWQAREIFIAKEGTKWENMVPEGIYIYDMTKGREIEKQIHDYTETPRPSHPERFILDVNSYIDNL